MVIRNGRQLLIATAATTPPVTPLLMPAFAEGWRRSVGGKPPRTPAGPRRPARSGGVPRRPHDGRHDVHRRPRRLRQPALLEDGGRAV